MFLADIYAHQENKPKLSLGMLKEARSEHPQSAFLHLMEIISLYNYGNIEDLDQSAKEFKEKVQDGTYVNHVKTFAFFSLGLTQFKKQNWAEAMIFFDKAIEVDSKINAFYTFSHLFKGYTLDLTDQRKEAIAQYKDVLSQLRRWRSHDNARKYLRKPFKINDPQMKKLSL